MDTQEPEENENETAKQTVHTGPTGPLPHEEKYRQLFLSTNIITEDYVFNGGILVDDDGVIIKLVKKKEAKELATRLKDYIEIIDAEDLVLMPGVVDSHVHVNEPGRTEWEGFVTATQAAAAGGITTIVDMPLNAIPPTISLETLRYKASHAVGNVYVDVGFWGGVIPGNHEVLKEMVKAGVVGFKCFLCPSGVDEFPHVGPEDLEMVFKELEGTGSVLAFHAETEETESYVPTTGREKKEVEKGKRDAYESFLETRPPIMELKAADLIMNFARKTNVRIHIVHVSAEGVVPIVEAARVEREKFGPSWQQGITMETCHHYLIFNSEDIPNGQSEFKCCPPIRDKQNKDQLWRHLIEDKIDMVVSDHSPCTPDLKKSNFLQAWGGISSLQFGLSLFWTEASERNLSLSFVVNKLCSSPAKLCGLDKKKGSLKPGLDADLIFFDPDETFTVTPDIIHHRNLLTPYLDRTLKGVVKKTFLRGKLIYNEKQIMEEPQGILLLKKYRREYPDYMYEWIN